jgi:hypothetical protein
MNMLFHFHYWTPNVEEMENFYKRLGFTVHQRIGKYNGEFKHFNPPLTVDDIREKNILFRIIEMKRGNINITFGYGKRPTFDHIGFFVSKDEHDEICKKSEMIQWKTKIDERRTFLYTPYGFSIELQTHIDALGNDGNNDAIHRIELMTLKPGLDEDLSFLFGNRASSVQTKLGDHVMIEKVQIRGLKEKRAIDMNGVELLHV